MEEDLEYIIDVVTAVSQKQYEDALIILNEGIDKNIKSKTPPKAENILKSLKLLIVGIEKTVEIDFGIKLRESVKMTENPPIKCGFCGKGEEERRIVLSGFDSRICNECVDDCKEFLTTNKSNLVKSDHD